MTDCPKIGALRVGVYSDYEPGADGFVIEEYWNDDLGWVIGNYEETGNCHLDGVFPTRNLAEYTLARG